MIAVVDYGMGNIAAICNMFKKLGVHCVAVKSPEELVAAEKIVLPGVGAFNAGVEHIGMASLREVLDSLALVKKIPVLGICLGMQLFGRASEEGNASGLGWLEADSVRFQVPESKKDIKIPHMGWNVARYKEEALLFKGFEELPRFYFVHSYHVICDEDDTIAAVTEHGIPFASAIQKDNIFGVQFHPEKSHRFGMKLFANFASL